MELHGRSELPLDGAQACLEPFGTEACAYVPNALPRDPAIDLSLIVPFAGSIL